VSKRIGFGLDASGFFAVLLEGDTALVRLSSTRDCDTAMWRGMAWGERLHVPVDVVRVDTRLLGMRP